MEKIAGTALLLIGIFFVTSGIGKSSGIGKPTEPAAESTRGIRVPAWLDRLSSWAIGILCLWFGASLILGHAHYF